MKGYILDINDKDIINVLKKIYITEDFKNSLCYLISQLNVSINEEIIEFLGIETLKVTRLILIDNVYRYLALNQYDHLLNLLQNKTIQNDLIIKNFYVTILADAIKERILFSIYGHEDFYNILHDFLYRVITLIFSKEEDIYIGLFNLMNILLSRITLFNEKTVIVNVFNQLLFLNDV